MKIYEYFRQKKKWHIILFGILIVYLLAANFIISLFIDENERLREINLSDLKSNGRTLAGIDIIWSKGNLLEDLTISGWAFSETEESNDNKSISVILKSDKKAYILRNAPLSIRQDINLTFKKNVSIMGMNHGFSANMSTFNIPNGKYEIYIYNYENKHNFGLYKTGRIISKKGSLINEIETSKVENQGKLVGTDNIDFNVDSVQCDNNKVAITGWGILKKQEKASEKYYLLISDKNRKKLIYEVNNTSRYDIGEAYGEMYTESGIYTVLPIKDLSVGEFSINLIIQDKQGFNRSNKTFYYNNVGDGTIDKVDKNKEFYESANTEQIQVKLDKLYSSENFRMGVDSAINVGGYLNIEGWCALLDTNTVNSQVYIELEDLSDGKKGIYEGLRYERNDIVEAFGNLNLNKCGFRARIPIYNLNMYSKEGQEDNKFKLNFYIYENGKLYKYKESKTYRIAEDLKVVEI